MKKIIWSFCVIVSGFLARAEEGDLQAFFYYTSYFSVEQGPFIETYLTIIGNSAVFSKNENGKLQAKVEITILFKKEDKIADFRKYVLKSPEVDSSTASFPNFIDQQRLSLPNGHYDIELKASDMNAGKKVFDYHDVIVINYNTENCEFSGIELVESYTPTKEINILSKCGYDLVPYVSDFFPENIEMINFYTELYNADKIVKNDEIFLLRYIIESADTKKPLSDFMKFQRQKAGKLNVLLGRMPIKELPSGNYNLVVEARNRENQLLVAKKMYFQRSNPKYSIKLEDVYSLKVDETFISTVNNLDTLRDYVKCLYPISDFNEIKFAENLLNQSDILLYQQFLYGFWLKRNNTNPNGEWMKYKSSVFYVNKKYGMQIRKGYETDRGRVYLQYGAPNSINMNEHEPGNYPYEIWHYYHIGEQSNCKFIFYNPDLVGNDYRLLHSDAKGEIYDKNWQLTLAKRVIEPGYILEEGGNSGTRQIDYYGNHSFDDFKNPK